MEPMTKEEFVDRMMEDRGMKKKRQIIINNYVSDQIERSKYKSRVRKRK